MTDFYHSWTKYVWFFVLHPKVFRLKSEHIVLAGFIVNSLRTSQKPYLSESKSLNLINLGRATVNEYSHSNCSSFIVHMSIVSYMPSVLSLLSITKTRLFKYIENFTPKNEKFQIKFLISFIFLLELNIDCWCSLEPPQWGGSNEYQQSMFWAEIRKIMYTHVNPNYIEIGFKGIKFI